MIIDAASVKGNVQMVTDLGKQTFESSAQNLLQQKVVRHFELN